MIIPVRCFTCGKVLADKYEYYVKESAKLEAEYNETTAVAAKANANADNVAKANAYKYFAPVKTGKLMDNIGLTRYCCRRHFLGAVDMMESI